LPVSVLVALLESVWVLVIDSFWNEIRCQFIFGWNNELTPNFPDTEFPAFPSTQENMN
jgi:hypothetical protein